MTRILVNKINQQIIIKILAKVNISQVVKKEILLKKNRILKIKINNNKMIINKIIIQIIAAAANNNLIPKTHPIKNI